MLDIPDGTVHAISIAGGLIAAGLSAFVSLRLSRFKEELIASVKENCASKESFDTHEEHDTQRFEQVEANAVRRHGELRQDMGRVETRLDSVILGRQRPS